MKRAILLALLGTVAVLATAVVAVGADYRPPPEADEGSAVDPSFVPGRVSNRCAGGGQKLDGSADGGATGDIDSGTYPFSFEGFNGTITITVNQTSDGPTFDFVTDDVAHHFVTSIYVKGGPAGANFYNYGAALEVGGDDGLHSPYNENSGKWYGLSHICVFLDKK